MTFVFDKLSDPEVVASAEENFPWAAYWNYPYLRSPSGIYVGGNDSINTSWLVDTTDPIELVWKADLSSAEYNDFFDVARDGFNAKALDDEGSMWGQPSITPDDRGVAEVPLSDHTPVFRYQWDDDSDSSAEILKSMWAYTMPDDSIFLLMLPKGTSEQAAHRYYTATKGDPTLATHDSVGWVPKTSFQDDAGDVWIVGVPGTNPQASMTLTRLTDVTGTSAYTSPQEFVTPSFAATTLFPVGFFADGAFIGGFSINEDWFGTMFRAEIDGSLDITTADVSANRVFFAWPMISAAMQNKPNPTKIFVVRENDDARVITEMTTDLTFGDSYNLDDWEAGDHETEASPETVFYPLYCDHRLAFYGTRYQFTDPPDNYNQTGDFFLYYFGGGVDDDLRLRVWEYSLDGHDYAIFRIGASATLPFDLTTNTWAHWQSPARTNWRAHVGQNWLGMGPVTFARGFGSDVVCGDDTTGQLWILDPTAGQDDDPDTGDPVPFTRKVVGGITLSSRETVPCGAFQLDASLGAPSLVGAEITLRTSDDNGHTWVGHGAITVAAAAYNAVIEWRGLGLMKAPGRIFEITDNGAAVRIGAGDTR